MPAYKPKSCWFDSQSGHMPGLWARSPVRGAQESTTYCFFSPSFSLHYPLSKKKLKKKRERERVQGNSLGPHTAARDRRLPPIPSWILRSFECRIQSGWGCQGDRWGGGLRTEQGSCSLPCFERRNAFANSESSGHVSPKPQLRVSI